MVIEKQQIQRKLMATEQFGKTDNERQGESEGEGRSRGEVIAE
jgi:hypothetical protein